MAQFKFETGAIFWKPVPLAQGPSILSALPGTHEAHENIILSEELHESEDAN